MIRAMKLQNWPTTLMMKAATCSKTTREKFLYKCDWFAKLDFPEPYTFVIARKTSLEMRILSSLKTTMVLSELLCC